MWHHLLVQQAAYYASKKLQWFASYAILGDDLVIGCPVVARHYRRLMRALDVKISETKSVEVRIYGVRFGGSCSAFPRSAPRLVSHRLWSAHS